MKGKDGYPKAAQLLASIMSMKPELASELGFLEIRQLSYEVKRISKIDRPSNEEIEKIYNQEYLSKINMWLNVVST